MAIKKLTAWAIFKNAGQDIIDVEDPDTGITMKAIFPNEFEAKKALEKLFGGDVKLKIFKVEV